MKIYSMSYVNFQMTSHTDTIPDIIETGSSDTSDSGSMQLSQIFFFANIINITICNFASCSVQLCFEIIINFL